jgi:hypothetical protein
MAKVAVLNSNLFGIASPGATAVGTFIDRPGTRIVRETVFIAAGAVRIRHFLGWKAAWRNTFTP